MKKIGIITFHASYNYGSMLQAYALQETIHKLVPDAHVQILNYRSDKQRAIYAYPWKRYEDPLLYIMKVLLLHSRKEKNRRFEQFMNNYLNLTLEFSGGGYPIEFDYYVCGSDQIWNFRAADYNDIYFLPDVHTNKIAYAASFGGHFDFSKQPEKIKQLPQLLAGFSFLSVRETEARKLIYESAHRDAQVVLDPVFLPDAADWDNVAVSDLRLTPGKFLFFYTIGYTAEVKKAVQCMADEYNVPIVISQYIHCSEILLPYKKAVKSGPMDFVWLVKNSACVFSTSFHGTAFSVIFHKEFFSWVGEKDERKTSLLSTLGLMDRALYSTTDFRTQIKNRKQIDWHSVDVLLNKEKEKSLLFLKRGLNLEETEN